MFDVLNGGKLEVEKEGGKREEQRGNGGKNEKDWGHGKGMQMGERKNRRGKWGSKTKKNWKRRRGEELENEIFYLSFKVEFGAWLRLS